MAIILSIETSCDETGVALLDGQKVLASAIASQIDTHALTGGVIPNVAAREHAKIITPLIDKVINEGIVSRGLGVDDIDAIAVTQGPGLIPALVIGVQVARTLSYAWQKPLVPINHMEGHVYSALLEGGDIEQSFPALALLVSGGHTMLVKIAGHLDYEILGQTRDDAAGEAFDKVARMLDLPYPGGPHLSKLATKGDPAAYDFTRPMMNSGDLDFSFSGLKTEVLYKIKEIAGPVTADSPKSSLQFRTPHLTIGRDGAPRNSARLGAPPTVPPAIASDLAASFQATVVDSLVLKTRDALRASAKGGPASGGQGKPFSTLLLAGGVAANNLLRDELKKMADEAGVELLIAPTELCGDNAVMIGQIAQYAFEQNRVASWQEIDASARLSLA